MAQGLTQEALALESKLSRNMVIGIEWGRKSIAYERLWDLADVLGVDVDDFFASPSAPATKRFTRFQERERRRRLFSGSSRTPSFRSVLLKRNK